MKRTISIMVGVALLAAVAAVTHATRARGQQPAAATAYVCPVTGEVLPCPACCPAKR